MADRIAELYQIASKKGVLAEGLTEEMFREQTKTDEGLRSFYDYASQNGMNLTEWPTFRGKARGEIMDDLPQQPQQPVQPAQQPDSGARVAEQQSPDRITSALAGMPDPLYSGQYQYHQQVAEKEAALKREKEATLPLSQQDIERQAKIDQLRQEQYSAGIESGNLLPSGKNAFAIDVLERQKPSYLTRKAQTPQDVYDITMEAWTANTPEGQKAKAQADKDTDQILTNIKQQFDADVDGHVAQLQKQFEAEPGVKELVAQLNKQFSDTEFKQLQDRVNRGELSVEDAQTQADAVWKEKYAPQIQEKANALWKEKYVPQVQSYADKLWEDTYKDIYSNEATTIQQSLMRQMSDANQDYLNQQLRKLGQAEVNRSTKALSEQIQPQVEKLEEARRKMLASRSGNGTAYGAIGAQMGTTNDESLSLLKQAQEFLHDAQKISEGAAQGGKGFWKDLGKGFGANIGDLDTWDFGIGQLVRSSQLKRIVEKYEQNKDSLTNEEKALMDAAVTYMASCAYNSDKLSRGYKAGQTTAESIPFMLQFLIMPVESLKNKVAKGILGYGLDQFGGKALQEAGKKYGLGAALKEAGTLLAGNIAAAGMQTAAFGLPKIAGGTISRMTGQIKPDFDEQGHLVYGGRQYQQNFGNALWNSTVDTYVENLSEMILTSGDPVRALIRGSEWFGKTIGKSEVVRFLADLEKTPFGQLAGRMQFRNYPEEVAEEYVGGLLKWGASTDIHSAKEAGLDVDSQIDIWLGLAPTSIAFAGLGVGGYAVQGGINRWQNSQAAANLRKIMEEGEERKYLESLLTSQNSEAFAEASHDVVKSILRNDKINDETKRDILDGIYTAYQSQVAQEAEQVQQAEEKQQPEQPQDRQTQLRQQAEQQAQQEVQGMAHQDGNVYYVGIKGKDGSEGYAVSGNLNMQQDDKGMYSTSGRDLVTVKMNDGSVQQVPADELVVRDLPVSANELIQERTDHYFAQYANNDLFHVGDKVYLKQNGQQSAESSTIVNINDEGIEVEIIGPDNMPNTTVIPHEKAAEALAVTEGETEDNIVTFTMQDGNTVRLRDMGNGVYNTIASEGEPVEVFTEEELAEAGAVRADENIGQGDFEIPQEEGYEYGKPTNIRTSKKGTKLADITRTHIDKDGNKVTEVITIKQDGTNVISGSTLPLVGYRIAGMDAETFEGVEVVGFTKLTELPQRTRVVDGRDADGNNIYREQDAVGELILKDENGRYSATVPLIRTDDQSSSPITTGEIGNEAPMAAPAYPTDETGNPAWGQMEVPQSAQVLFDLYKGNRESAKAYADDQLKEAEKAQKAFAKQASHNLNLAQRLKEEEINAKNKAIADAEVKYWEDVKLAIAQIKSAEELAAEQAQREAMMAAREQRSHTEEGTVTAPTMAERYNAAAKIEGNTGTMTLPDGRELNGRYMLIAPQGVTPSHDVTKNFQRSEGYPVTSNGQSINDRDYTSDKEEQQKVVSIAQNFNGNAIKNMPVISDEGLVYNGNGRMMAGQLAAINGTDAAYFNSLMNNAGQYGFTEEQLKSIPHARVVFQLDERLPYSTQSLAIFNEQETQTQSNTGKAAGYARKLTPQAVSEVLAAVDGFNTIDAFFSDKKAPFNLINSLINAGIIAQREKAEMVDGDKLSATGRERLSNILFGTVFDNETIRLMGDDAALKNSILRALPQILENKSLGEFSLESDINDAIRLLYQVRNAGMPFRSFVSQTVIAEDGQVHTAAEGYSPYQLLLAEEMTEGGVDAFRDVLTAYNNEARNVQGGQVDIFGDLLTPTELKNLILQRYGKEPTETERPSAGRQTDNAPEGTPASNEPAAEVSEPEKIVPERPNSKQLQGMSYNVAEAEDMLGRMARNILNENGYEDVEIVGVKVIGSRVNGNAREDSDLDCLIEFKGNAREDSLFNLFEEQGIELDGVKVDINPITEGKSGTIEQFMRRSDEYLAEKAAKEAAEQMPLNDKLEHRLKVIEDEQGKEYADQIRNFVNARRVEGAESVTFAVDRYFNVIGVYPSRIEAFKNKNAYDVETFKIEKETPNVYEQLAQAEAETDTNPTEAQKKAENYKQGHVTLWGLPITIENPKGSIRRGTDANGKQWEQEMHHTYGKIRRTEGVDGDHIDVFIGPNLTSDKVFVVDQRNVDTGEFDEHKCMLGFDSLEDAQNGYLSNYEEGWQGMGTVTEVTMDEFKKWIDSSHRKTKPFAEYKSVKTEGAASTAMEEPDAMREELAEELRKFDMGERSPMDENLVYDTDDMQNAVRDILKRYNSPKLQAAMDAITATLERQRAAGSEWLDAEDEEQTLIDTVREVVGDKATSVEDRSLYEQAKANKAAAERGKPVSKMKKDEILAELERYAEGNLFDMTPRMAKRILSLAKKYGKNLPEPLANMADNAALLTGENSNKVTKNAKNSKKSEENSENILINQNNLVTLQPNEKVYTADGLSVVVNTKDYRTYLTSYAKEVFAKLGQQEKKPHKRPELSYIHYASYDGVIIPLEVLKSDPAIIEAQAKIDSITDSLELPQEQIESYARRLLDNAEGEIKQERKAFIIIGRPAGGKSSVFANPLSKEHAARIIDSDDAKPMLDGYDNGDGAGYVQKASDAIMQEALWKAAINGDNLVIPKIGGGSVIDEITLPLKELGYSVELYYNEVGPEISFMRAMARFAITGRYLSLNYLASIGDKPTKTFNNYSTKNIGETINELSSQKIQNLRGRIESLHRMEEGNVSARLDEGGRGVRGAGLSALLERGESGENPLVNAPLFDHYEWKSNEVSPGEEPKLIKKGDNKPTPPSEPAPTKPTKRTTKKEEPKANFENNTLFTADAVAEARKRLAARRNRLNMGLNPEDAYDYTIIAGAYVEQGVRKFADFCKAMIQDLGDAVRPYLQSIYDSLRHDPQVKAQGWQKDFDSHDVVDNFDVDNFAVEEEQPAKEEKVRTPEEIAISKMLGTITKSKHTKTGEDLYVVSIPQRVSDDEFKVLKARAKANNGYYSSFAKNRGFVFKDYEDAKRFNTINDEEVTDAQTSANTEAVISQAETVAATAETIETPEQVAPEVTPEAKEEQVTEVQQVIEQVDDAVEQINEQLAVLGYYEADTDDPSKWNESYGFIRSAEAKALKDIDRLAKQLAADLGIEVNKRKKIASANLAPAGGDISFRLPLSEDGKELYLTIDVAPNESWRVHYNPEGSEYDLVVDGLMWRVEDTKVKGFGRYLISNQIYREGPDGFKLKYKSLVDSIRRQAKDYLPKVEEASAPVEHMSDLLEEAKKRKAASDKRKKDKTRIPDGQQVLSLFDDAVEDLTEAARQEEQLNDNNNGNINESTEGAGRTTPEGSNEMGSNGTESNGGQQTGSAQESSGRRNTGRVAGSDAEQNGGETQQPTATGTEQPRSKRGSASGTTGGVSSGDVLEDPTIEHGDRRADDGSLRTPKEKNTPKNTRNYLYPEDAGEIDNMSPMERLETNVEALEVLRTLLTEDREATPEERATLGKLRGWGGINVPDNYTAKYTPLAMNPLQKRLVAVVNALDPNGERKLLDSLRTASLTSYYTPIPIARAMHAIAEQAGYKGNGNMLDPSMGNGVFEGSMAKGVQQSTNIRGVELDWLTGQIAQKLYPDARINITGFQDAHIPQDYYDYVVSNIPFGSLQITDLDWQKNPSPIRKAAQGKIHNYFAVKMIESTRPGGLCVIMTSNAIMDTMGNQMIRQYITENCEVLGAIRLPNNTFKGAGTRVVTDVIYLRKFRNVDDSININDNVEYANKIKAFFENPQLNDLPDGKGGTKKVRYNSYFMNHAENVIGTPVAGGQYTDDAYDQESDLTTDEIAKKIEEIGRRFIEERKKRFGNAIVGTPIRSIDIKERIKERYVGNGKYEDSGNIVVMNGLIGKLETVKDGNVKQLMFAEQKLGSATVAQVTDYANLRSLLKQLIHVQIENYTSDRIDEVRKQMQQAYTAYTKKYGKLCEKKNAFIEEDIDGYQVRALEQWKDGKFVGMADIYTKNTIASERDMNDVSDPQAAVLNSLAEYGNINTEYLQRVLGDNFAEACKGLIFEDPSHQGEYIARDVYLSGDVVTKLEYARQMAEEDSRFQENVTALEAIQPKRKEFGEFPCHMGARWIPVQIYNDFLNEIFGVRGNWKGQKTGITYVEATNEYIFNFVPSEFGGNAAKYATSRKSASDIFQAALLDKDITVKYKDDEGKEHTDQEATDAARDKVAELREAFEDWVPQKPERVQQLTDTYNSVFNRHVLPTYNGQHLNIVGLQGMKLRPHQKDAVWRIINQRGGIVDHIVGAGKSLVMQASIMEMRRMGIAKKPMILALKSTTQQIANEFRQAFPAARVLAPTEADFSTQNRKRFLAQIAVNDYDCIILSHEQYSALDHTEAIKRSFIEDQIAQLDNLLEYLYGQKDESQLTKKQIKGLEKRKENLKERLKKLELIRTDEEFVFENLGVDYLFVDECQAFKNLMFQTSYSQIAGLGNPEGSERSTKLLYGVRALQEMHQGDMGTVFLSGTTITNSLSELYNIFNYLRPNEMARMGLNTFDAWASTFAVRSTEAEFGATNELKEKSRFRKFEGLQELSRLYTEIADVRNDNNLELPKPKLHTVFVSIPISDTMKKINDAITDMVKNHNGSFFNIKPERVDKYPWSLSATNLAKLATLSPKLIDPSYDDENGKIFHVCENVKKIYDQFDKQKGVQLIFCDAGVSGTGKKFDAYTDIIRRLTKDYGIPRSEIADIHEAGDDAKRQALFKKVNEGKVRIVIGGTKNMGTGVNVQQRVVAMHHIDIPWTPADVNQRNGRGSRQGNEIARDYNNNQVDAYYYAVERTLDTYRYQLQDVKGKMIDSFKMANVGVNEFDEGGGDDNMSPAEMVAILSGNPVILDKAKQDKLVDKLKRLQRSSVTEYARRKSEYEMLQKSQSTMQDLIRRNAEDIETLKRNGYEPDAEGNWPTLHPVLSEYERVSSGKTFEKPTELGAAIHARIKETGTAYLYAAGINAKVMPYVDSYGETKLGEYELQAQTYSGVRYTVKLSDDDTAAGQAMQNLLRKIYTNAEVYKRRLEEVNNKLEGADPGEYSFPRQAELDAALAKKREIDAEYNKLIVSDKKPKQAETTQEAQITSLDYPQFRNQTEAQQLATAALVEVLNDNTDLDVFLATDEQMPEDGSETSIKVNHNSPYLLKKADGSFVDPETGERLGFDHRFMGEGEGGQAHGWGSYFSVDDIRRYAIPAEGLYTYKGRNLAQLLFWKNDQNHFGTIAYIIEEMQKGVSVEDAIAAAYKSAKEILAGYKKNLNASSHLVEVEEDRVKMLENLDPEDFQSRGQQLHHYDVEIPEDNGENYLDEMKTIEKPLRRKIADAVRNLEGSPAPSVGYANYRNGWESLADMIERNQWAYLEVRDRLVQAFGGGWRAEKRLSEMMHDLGFVGVRYKGRRDGECYVIFNENDAKIINHREAMLTPNGTLYGWAIGDRIYLTKDGLNPNSPIHEYSHIWAKAMMRNNREGWQSIVDIFKGTPFWDEVVNDPNYQGLTTDDAICSEVLARYSGTRGAARMEEWAQEELHEAEQSGSLLRGAKVRQLINRAKKALADFWHWVGVNLFGIKHFDSTKQVADRVLWDMLNGTELKPEDQTTTNNFKAWFGDWQNDPEHASKVVDADDKPLVVEHSTPNEFTTFDIDKLGENSGDRGIFGAGFYFGDRGNTDIYGKNHMQVYLNMRKPFVMEDYMPDDISAFIVEHFNTPALRKIVLNENGKSITVGDYIEIVNAVNAEMEEGKHDAEIERISSFYRPDSARRKVRDDAIADKSFLIPGSLNYLISTMIGSQEFTNALRENGNDGVIVGKGNGYNEYVVFSPNQIKSATNNNGEFSEDNDNSEMMISRYTPEQMRAIQEWNDAHPHPQYNYGETLDRYKQRLDKWEEERKRFREQLKSWQPSTAAQQPSVARSNGHEQRDNESFSSAKPAFVPGVRPTPLANEAPYEYALRLRQYYQLMRDERLVAEYVAEINNQADAAAKVLKKNTIVRGLLDAAKPIENFQEWMKQRGATITDESNAYTDTFLATGRVTEANEQMQRDIIRPLAKQIVKIIAPDAKTGKSRLDGINIVWHNMDVAGTGSKLDGKALTPREIIGVYCQAKDCAEAIEKGLPDRGAKGFLNNLGMSHDDVIAAVESVIPRSELDELWRLINAATHFALNYDYESGRISEDTHTEFYQREFYVPQRGWRERDESGLITEYEPVGKRGNDPYNAALVKAHGRQSLASDPFAYIMSIDASSIVSSENNKIKQKFLQFCLDNENLGLQTGAFRVKKYWIMNVIDPETGKIKLDEEGNPMMEVSYVAPTAEDLSHDRTIKELIKKKRKEWAKVNQAYLERQSHGELGPQLEAAYKTKLSKIEQAIEDLEQQMHIAWNATNTNITQRTSDEKKQHEVRVLLDGQEYLIEVQDEKLANSINKKFKQHQEQLFNTSQKMRNATRFMSAVLTQYNPEFAASNFARDFQVALATLTAEHPELVGSFLKNFAACQPAVWIYAFNDKVRDRAVFRDSELGRYLQEYFKAGAATGFSYMQDLKSLRQDFDAMINESNLRRGIKGAVGTLSMLTQVSETAVRFAGYVAARQKGMGINEAAYLSKELTTNFDRAGEVADSGWMSWFSFFRATLNGNIKFLKALKKMPLAYSLIAAAYVAMGMLNQFLNPDDPEDEVWAGDYTRQSNFVIGKWRIPTAHFLRMFFSAGVNAAKWMQGEKSFGEATYNTATFATNELLPDYLDVMNWTDWDSDTDRMTMPWDGDNYKKGVRGFIPTPISPIADVWANRDFMGATINYPADDGKKDILRAKKKTLPIYQWLTQAIYEGVGGDMNTKRKSDDPAWRSWLFDTSASSVEHVAEGYIAVGGMDMFITIGEAIYDAATGTPTGPDKWPFVRKFYNAYTPERAYMQQYYLLNGRVKEFKRNMDDYRKNDRTKYNILTHSQEYRNYQEAERLVKKQKENPTTADVQALINANKQWIK